MIPIEVLDFRIATVEDLSTLTNLRMVFAQEYNSQAKETEILATQKAIHEYIRLKMSRDEYLGYLVSYENQVIASASVLIYQLPPLIQKLSRYQGHVLNMITLNKYRNQGVGGKLMAFISKDCKIRGLDRLYLNALPGTEGFYALSGFKKMDEQAMIKTLN